MKGKELYNQLALRYWPKADARLTELAWESREGQLLSPLMDTAIAENYCKTLLTPNGGVAVQTVASSSSPGQCCICIRVSSVTMVFGDDTGDNTGDKELRAVLTLPPLLPAPPSTLLADYGVFTHSPKAKRHKRQEATGSQRHLLVIDFDQTLTKAHTFATTTSAVLNINTLTPAELVVIREHLSTNLRAPDAMRFIITELVNSNQATIAVVSFHDNPAYIKLALEVLLQDEGLVNKISVICIESQDQKQRKAPQIDVLRQAFNINGSVLLIDDDAKNIHAACLRGWQTVHAEVTLGDEGYVNRIVQNLPIELQAVMPNLSEVHKHIATHNKTPQ